MPVTLTLIARIADQKRPIEDLAAVKRLPNARQVRRAPVLGRMRFISHAQPLFIHLD